MILFAMLWFGYLLVDFYLSCALTRRIHLSDKLVGTACSVVIAAICGGIFIYHHNLPVGMAVVAAIVMGVIYLATVLSEQVYGRYCKAILIRQLIHLVVIVVACAALSPQFVHELMVWVANSNIIFIALGYLLILKPASTLVGVLLKPWSEHLTQSQDTPTSLANAGQWIGYLERFIALTFILSHQYAAVGWILGAKSIFRFGELRNSHDKKLTEYIMVGTLASFAVTILIGVLVNSLQEIG